MADELLSPRTISDERMRSVEKARQVWISRLMDTTRRNNLLYFRELSTGTLDFSSSNPATIRSLFNEGKVPLSRLIGAGSDPRAGVKLREIVRKAQANLEEKGLNTLFIAYGMATWAIDDGGRPPEAAIVLLPIAVEGRRADPDSMVLQATAGPQANIALLHALSEEHGISIAEEDLLQSGVLEDNQFDPELVVQYLHGEVSRVRGFTTKARIVIGNFSFQKLAMVKDLRESAGLLAGHDMIAALSGDPEARTALGGRHVSIEPSALDSVPAENEFMVLDADSSQQAVVHSVAGNLDGVIQGPPGCGKSQTIANVIATLVAEGKRVLFVAEKRAALEAVYKRLSDKGLGHLALDLHGAAISQRSVMARVAENLERIRNANIPRIDELHERFEDRRSRLGNHAVMMHLPQPGSGLTPYQMQAGIVETAKFVSSKTRWRHADLAAFDRKGLSRALDLLTEAQSVSSLILRTDLSPWTGANLSTGEDVQPPLDAARKLSEDHLPKVRRSLAALTANTSIPMPATIGEAERLLALCIETNEFLEKWDERIFNERNLADELGPVSRSFLHQLWATLTRSDYRRAKRRAREFCKGDLSGSTLLLAGAEESNSLVGRWDALSGASAKPTKVDVPGEAVTALRLLLTEISTIHNALPELVKMPFDELSEVVARLARDEVTAHTIPTVRRIERELDLIGVGAILQECRSESVPPEKWHNLLKHAYYSSCYDAVRATTPSLAAFRGDSHSKIADEFRSLDRERLKLAAERVSRNHSERAIQAMNEAPDQTLLLRQEAKKRSRHLTLRKLVSKAPDVLTAVCPCWMSSPLNVSQLLPADRRYFDVVIFDEASQVLPEDAVCSVLRGNRLVVAGDPHQLPPTSFFADGAAEEEEDAPMAGFESLLDQMSAFVDHWPLDWHYRSRDERLIAFSNRHIYGNRLVTFPGTGGTNAISHVLVNSVPRDGEEDSSSAEVERVVQLILVHAEAQVNRHISERESLGVIAFGIKHANRVQATLDRALASRTDLSDFLDTSKDNPWFFLKNLERVQGDERDVIILTVGYGKDRNGRLPYRFGPLLREGGERRLNVAITRAMKRIVVVSSFAHTDMDPRRSDSKGVELLRLYLQFAASTGTNLGDIGGTGEPMNSFESDVHDALTRKGVPLLPQYGVSGFRLDFAAMHPDREGEFVLAIECDGATYHSSPTARDRDRLRQQQLEAIGWSFHRIWSTDWFLRREYEIERAVKAWEHSVQAANIRSQPIASLFDDFRVQLDEEPSVKGDAYPVVRDRPRPAPVVTSLDDLVELVNWIRSDGQLRTDSEIIDEVLPHVGYKRRGHRIVQIISEAIREADLAT